MNTMRCEQCGRFVDGKPCPFCQSTRVRPLNPGEKPSDPVDAAKPEEAKQTERKRPAIKFPGQVAGEEKREARGETRPEPPPRQPEPPPRQTPPPPRQSSPPPRQAETPPRQAEPPPRQPEPPPRPSAPAP